MKSPSPVGDLFQKELQNWVQHLPSTDQFKAQMLQVLTVVRTGCCLALKAQGCVFSALPQRVGSSLSLFPCSVPHRPNLPAVLGSHSSMLLETTSPVIQRLACVPLGPGCLRNMSSFLSEMQNSWIGWPKAVYHEIPLDSQSAVCPGYRW